MCSYTLYFLIFLHFILCSQKHSELFSLRVKMCQRFPFLKDVMELIFIEAAAVTLKQHCGIFTCLQIDLCYDFTEVRA